MRYEVVCTKEYLSVGLCVEINKNLKPTRVLARPFPYSSTDVNEYGIPEYGGVELLDWINTGVFMSPKEWADISYNKPIDQILRELGIEKKMKEEKDMTTVRKVVDDRAFEKKYNIEWCLGNGEIRTTSAVMTSIENGYIFFRYPSGGIFVIKDDAIRSLECLE